MHLVLSVEGVPVANDQHVLVPVQLHPHRPAQLARSQGCSCRAAEEPASAASCLSGVAAQPDAAANAGWRALQDCRS